MWLKRCKAYMNEIKKLISIDGNTDWIRIKDGDNRAEGKFHHGGDKKIIIFEPGFPGDASTRLEKLWLDNLLKNGFSVFATRHVGTIINGLYSETYLNSPERQDLARENKENLLGGKESYTIADWLLEPLVVLKAFASQFEEIYLIGHSFGGLAIFYSTIEFAKGFPDLSKKIKRLISLAGTTGKIKGGDDPIIKQWLDHLKLTSISERINIGDPERNVEILKDAYVKIHSESSFVPKSTEIICVMVENDELVSPNEADDIMKTLGRGNIILDTKEKADKNSGRLAHDMDNLTPQFVLDLVDCNWKPMDRRF